MNANPLYTDSILEGDCRELLKHVPDEHADLILTDPPYLVNYRDRYGRTIRNDRNAEVLDCFVDLYRVLKPGSLCISFYGWNRVDDFFAIWRRAGFRPVGHIVWRKNYASSTGYLAHCHEQAYVLAKGKPVKPAKPIDDVRQWTYTGNRDHPTQKSPDILRPLIEAFSKPGDLVLDPFSGSGSTSIAAAQCDRHYLGIELERVYVEIAQRRLNALAGSGRDYVPPVRSLQTEQPIALRRSPKFQGAKFSGRKFLISAAGHA